MQRLAIFDLDDTLLDTSDVYWRSREAFLAVMEGAGFERSSVLEDFESMDERSMAEYGFAPERYEASMVATYADLCQRAGLASDPSTLAKARSAGQIVQSTFPAVIEGAIELLDGARNEGMNVVLVTRGVDDVQKRKIEAHQLSGHFDWVEVVAKKDAALFSRLIRKSGVRPRDCWVIGDSVRSDINPGIEAGANCILYLYTHHSYHWRQEYGAPPTGDFWVARSLNEVLQILRHPQLSARVSSVPERDPSLDA